MRHAEGKRTYLFKSVSAAEGLNLRVRIPYDHSEE
jgi:hypothetical protein